MSVAARPLTWDDIKDWPEDSTSRVELVQGQVVMSPSPNVDHAWVCSKLQFALTAFVDERELGAVLGGPVDVILAPDTVYVPDICFVRRERFDILRDRVWGAPDLCVEIVSESNRTHDTVVKHSDYARYGVLEYWLVDPREREISTWRNAGERFELIGRAKPGEAVPTDVLAGLELDPVRVFRPQSE